MVARRSRDEEPADGVGGGLVVSRRSERASQSMEKS